MTSSLNYTCAIKPPNATLICWGRDTHSEMDIPNTHTHHLHSVKASLGYICALTATTTATTGSLRCWGNNDYGNCDIPLLISTSVRDYATAGMFTCVVTTSSYIACQGTNGLGLVDVPTPLQNNVHQVYAGMNHVCVMKDNYKVYCWGEKVVKQIKPFKQDPGVRWLCISQLIYAVTNEMDVIGYNTENQYLSSEDLGFLEIIKGEKVIHAQANVQLKNRDSVIKEVFCIINTERRIRCTKYCRQINVDEISIPRTFNSKSVNVVIGQKHRCGMKTTGQIRCWGDNQNGQLDVPEALTYNYTMVKVGYSHTCTLQGVGSVHCVGDDTYGQVSFTKEQINIQEVKIRRQGDDTSYENDQSSKDQNLDNQQFKQVGTGFNTTCVLGYNNQFKCFGRDKDNITSIPYSHVLNVAHEVKSPLLDGINVSAPAKSLSISNRHVCITTMFDKMLCWGWNKQGQTEAIETITEDQEVDSRDYSGHRNDLIGKINDAIFKPNEDLDPSSSTNVYNINSIYKLNDNGDDVQFNNNIENKNKIIIPKLVQTQVKVISAGGAHTCYIYQETQQLKIVEKFKCQGLNLNGQVTLPQIPNKVYNITAGYKHTCALHIDVYSIDIDADNQDTKITCWGRDRQGQTDTSVINKYISDQHQQRDINNYQQVLLGRAHTCVISDNFKTYCYGSDKQGQVSGIQKRDKKPNANEFIVNQGAISADNPLEKQTHYLYQSDNLQHIDANFDQTCGINMFGKVNCWGKVYNFD